MFRTCFLGEKTMYRYLFPILGVSTALALACGSSDDSTDEDGAAGESASGGAGARGGMPSGGNAGEAGATADRGGAGGDDCPQDGSGTLEVEVTGLPSGVAPAVTLTGPGSPEIDDAGTYESVPAGSYTVRAGYATQADEIVRSAYSGVADQESFCLRDGETVTLGLSYELVPSSNKLWTPTNLVPELAGFAAATLGASGASDADVLIDGPSGREVAFDRDGNLWTFGPTLADPMLVRFSAGSLGESGAPEPDVEINVPEVTCIVALRAMAFDTAGNLWLSVCGNRVIRLDASELTESGDAEIGVELTAVNDNQGLAFDAQGNLWIADDGTLIRFDATRLFQSDEDAPDRVLSVRDEPDTRNLSATALAFDSDGDLWATDFGANYVFQVGAADLEGSGDGAVIAKSSVALGVTALLDGIAFDESENLWLGLSSDPGGGELGMLSKAQLEVSSGPGDPTIPSILITSEGLADAGGVAVYPAPAALPLFHSLP
jgi:hypothetical protein